MAPEQTTTQRHLPRATGLLCSLLLAAAGSVHASEPADPATGGSAVSSNARHTLESMMLEGSNAANAVLMRAIGLVGTPYRWGGNTPEGGFDCSGLVNYVFRDMLDLILPRTSRELAAWRQGPEVPASALATGDLVFFGSGGVVSHVGIYVGDGRFVHAPSTGGTVRLDRMDGSYWQRRYTGARRVL
ncbi:MAG: C40 family peptidase [Pseudoxanthomonas suwonensis]|nr:C40 family peptidase [Pseudoxanthomonas suwonensis]